MLESRLQLEYWVQFWAPDKRKTSGNWRQTGTSSEEISKVVGAGALALGGEAEGGGPGEPGDGMALGKLTCSLPIPVQSHQGNRTGLCTAGQREDEGTGTRI